MIALNLAGVDPSKGIVRACATALSTRESELSEEERLVLSELLERSDTKGVKVLDRLNDALR